MPGTDAPGIPAALGFGQQVSWAAGREPERCSLWGHGHVLGAAGWAGTKSIQLAALLLAGSAEGARWQAVPCMSQAAARGRSISGLYVLVRVEMWPL